MASTPARTPRKVAALKRRSRRSFQRRKSTIDQRGAVSQSQASAPTPPSAKRPALHVELENGVHPLAFATLQIVGDKNHFRAEGHADPGD